MEPVKKNLPKQWAHSWIERAQQIITYPEWLEKELFSQIRRTLLVIECMRKPTCHGSQVVTLTLLVEPLLVATHTLPHPADLIQIRNLVLVPWAGLIYHQMYRKLSSKCPINIKHLNQVYRPLIQNITILIGPVWVLAQKVTSPIKKKTNRFLALSTIVMRRMQLVIWVKRITRKLCMDSLTSMINGKRLAIKEWNSIFLWERPKAPVPTLNKTLFIYHLQRKLQNSQCPKAIEDFYHLSQESPQALDSMPMAHNQLEHALKINRLQCLKHLVMFHFQNMELSIPSLSKKDYSERVKILKYMINFAWKK